MNRKNILIWSLATCGTLLLSLFGPWVNALGGVIHASATQGDDAPLLIGGCVLVALAFWRFPTRLFTPLLGIVTACLTAFEVYDTFSTISDAKTELSHNDFFSDAGNGLVSPGWGLYLAALAALSLFAVSIALLRNRRSLQVTVTPVVTAS